MTKEPIVIIDEVKRILIIAGNPKEANYYKKREGWGDWKFISSTEDFKGEKDVIIAFCGTWFKRLDASAVAHCADDLVLRGLAEQRYVSTGGVPLG